MVVGFISISPSEMVQNSSGNPPASHTPRLTASATWRKCALQLLSSLQELQMPITGLPCEHALAEAFGAQPGAMRYSPAIVFSKPIAAAEFEICSIHGGFSFCLFSRRFTAIRSLIIPCQCGRHAVERVAKVCGFSNRKLSEEPVVSQFEVEAPLRRQLAS